MITHADTFVFRLTSTCDKHCFLCCNNYEEIKHGDSASFASLRYMFSEIQAYCSSAERPDDSFRPRVILTGGEALLYRSKDTERHCLLEVIEAVTNLVPQAKIIVKTGGFRQTNEYQRTLFDRVAHAFPFPIVEWRFGWNLYQDSIENALDRFNCTVVRILSHQHFVDIDTIYDKTSLESTCCALEEGLRQIGINAQDKMLLRFVLDDPNKHRRLAIKINGYTISIDLGPSYAPSRAAAIHEFYSEPSADCETIENGTSCLYYDTNMGLIHCNDSFVDARIHSLNRGTRSVADDLTFLNERFGRLRHFVALTRPRFASRKDRCFFCTRFVMTSLGDTAVEGV
jgi:hypothetical protein